MILFVTVSRFANTHPYKLSFCHHFHLLIYKTNFILSQLWRVIYGCKLSLVSAILGLGLLFKDKKSLNEIKIYQKTEVVYLDRKTSSLNTVAFRHYNEIKFFWRSVDIYPEKFVYFDGFRKDSKMSNRRNLNNCQVRIFKFKFDCFATEKNECMAGMQELLKSKTRPVFTPVSLSMSMFSVTPSNNASFGQEMARE